MDDVKLSKLSEEDNIEGFLTVFEQVSNDGKGNNRRAVAANVGTTATVITKAQQAYEVVNTACASSYRELTATILLSVRYGINSSNTGSVSSRSSPFNIARLPPITLKQMVWTRGITRL